MAKISPASIKYMIHANFVVEGALEKPDVIGAIFGQTEGLLGADLEMRELQKEGKIGRIEVELERKNKMTTGVIKIPTALDQSETTLIAAAVETIEKMGPCDAQIEVERIEDVRGSKREYIIERAKKLMGEIKGKTDSREISKVIKDAARTTSVQEYGKDKLSSGDLSGKEIIVVEGRADVMNLLKAGIDNVISMNGTKLPDSIKELSEEKDITLFVDGDRGGELIVQNVLDNAKVKYIAFAPNGKEVEELSGKEILMNLRKKVSTEEFLEKSKSWKGYGNKNSRSNESEEPVSSKVEKLEITKEVEGKLKEIYSKNKGSGKAVLLDNSLEEIKIVSSRTLGRALENAKGKISVIVIDGTVTGGSLKNAEEANVSAVVAKNFTTTDTSLKLLSF